MAHARATLGTSGARTNRARGWKSPKPPLGKRNAPRQRRQGERGRAIVGKTRRALQRQRRRAAPRGNGNSAAKLGLFSHKPLGAGLVVVKPLGNANADPKRRARWGNDQAGTNTGMILARSPIGRGATTFSRWEARSPAPEENGTTHSPRNPTPSRGTTKQPFYTPPKTRAA